MSRKAPKEREKENTRSKGRRDVADDGMAQRVFLPGSTTARDLQVQGTLTSVQRWILEEKKFAISISIITKLSLCSKL